MSFAKVFLVRNTHNNDMNEKVFRTESDADDYADELIRRIHRIYCVEKRVDVTDCLCKTSNGQQQCAAHWRVQNMREHKPDECPQSEGCVWVEEKCIH